MYDLERGLEINSKVSAKHPGYNPEHHYASHKYSVLNLRLQN